MEESVFTILQLAFNMVLNGQAKSLSEASEEILRIRKNIKKTLLSEYPVEKA